MSLHDLELRAGRDWGPPNLDALGYTYISTAFLHTAIIIAFLGVLYTYKATDSIRLRCFQSITLTVVLLQIFAIFTLLAYPLNGLYKCGAEFWVMNTMLPLSMALFQASNIRLLSCYQEQLRLVQNCYLRSKDCHKSGHKKSVAAWWSRLSCAERTYTGALFGVGVQFIVSFAVYFGSRRFHASYGFFSEHVDATECRRGFEWVPSIFWQLLWTTVAGPYILFRIRYIRDNHYWAWQTRLAIIACLPGTPLWLVFTFANSPQITTINRYFAPSCWFLPGIVMMQLISIFFPILDAKRHQAPKPLPLPDELSTSTMELQLSPKGRDPYSMASLEMQISKNLDPLLRWAAEKEFTAENIIFLRAVRDFKKKWTMALKRSGILSNECQRERYEDAALIWFKLVNPLTARFNINIDYKTLKELEQLFEGLHYEPYDSDDGSLKSENTASSAKSSKTDNIVAPWEDHERPRSFYSQRSSRIGGNDVVDKLYKLPITEISQCESLPAVVEVKENLEDEIKEPAPVYGDTDVVDDSYDVQHIPPAFNNSIFDKAFESVKNDVFRNTWVRYEAASFGKRPREEVIMAQRKRADSTKQESILMATNTEANEDGYPVKKKKMWTKIKEFTKKLAEI